MPKFPMKIHHFIFVLLLAGSLSKGNPIEFLLLIIVISIGVKCYLNGDLGL